MNRIAAAVGLVLVALGLAIFGWKALVYDLPVLPTDAEGLWRVELDVTVRGSGGRGSVRAPVPSTAPGQEVNDERSAADRLLFTIRNQDGERTAVWRGALDGVHDIAYGFRVRLAPVEVPLPADAGRGATRRSRSATANPTREFPSDAPGDRGDAAGARAAAGDRRGGTHPLDLRDGRARGRDGGRRHRRRAAGARQSHAAASAARRRCW